MYVCIYIPLSKSFPSGVFLLVFRTKINFICRWCSEMKLRRVTLHGRAQSDTKRVSIQKTSGNEVRLKSQVVNVRGPPYSVRYMFLPSQVPPRCLRGPQQSQPLIPTPSPCVAGQNLRGQQPSAPPQTSAQGVAYIYIYVYILIYIYIYIYHIYVYATCDLAWPGRIVSSRRLPLRPPP